MNPGAELPPEEPEMPIVVEKTRVNAFNAFGFLVVVFGMGGAWAYTSSDVKTANDGLQKANASIQEIRDNQVLRAQITDRNNQDTKATLSAVPELKFNQDRQAQEIADLKKSIEATNLKVDRFMELLNAKLDTIGENINGLRVDVRVLGAAGGKRAELESEKRPSRQ
jgi:cell division protein FtsI/penicillin-binding protein 2